MTRRTTTRWAAALRWRNSSMGESNHGVASDRKLLTSHPADTTAATDATTDLIFNMTFFLVTNFVVTNFKLTNFKVTIVMGTNFKVTIDTVTNFKLTNVKVLGLVVLKLLGLKVLVLEVLRLTVLDRKMLELCKPNDVRFALTDTMSHRSHKCPLGAAAAPTAIPAVWSAPARLCTQP